MLQRTLLGVLGSGQIGYSAFDRRSWSGISYHLFTNLREQMAFHRAIGVELPRLPLRLMMLRHVHPDRATWQKHFYMSPAYRDGLTEQVRRALLPEDRGHDVLQLGAMYNVPSLVGPETLCFSYHDGNLARSAASPHAPRSLSPRRVQAGLAYERKVYSGIDRVFAMSDYLRRSFINDFDVPAERVSNIGAGVNLDEIPEPTPDKRYDTQAVLFLGADFTRKGGPQLLEAFRRVRETHPRATLHIVGPKALTIPPEQSAGVEFHGYLQKSDPAQMAVLNRLFRECCLFVLPSLYEPFGIAPLEAMLYEVPAIVSGDWALQESVTPGVTGEHVRPGSVDDLVDRMRSLLGDPDALARMGRAGREHVLAHHTWPAVVRKMIEEISAVQAGSLARASR
jgi:glycosyltransferase involved in cell wall biosynthesis